MLHLLIFPIINTAQFQEYHQQEIQGIILQVRDIWRYQGLIPLKELSKELRTMAKMKFEGSKKDKEADRKGQREMDKKERGKKAERKVRSR